MLWDDNERRERGGSFSERKCETLQKQGMHCVRNLEPEGLWGLGSPTAVTVVAATQ